MTQDDKKILKNVLIFLSGVLFGALILFANYKNTYQGKTADEWAKMNSEVQSKLSSTTQSEQELQTAHNNLIGCLGNAKKYTDYYGGISYYVNDVTDIGQCIEDSRQWLFDQGAQDLEQKQQDAR